MPVRVDRSYNAAQTGQHRASPAIIRRSGGRTLGRGNPQAQRPSMPAESGRNRTVETVRFFSYFSRAGSAPATGPRAPVRAC